MKNMFGSVQLEIKKEFLPYTLILAVLFLGLFELFVFTSAGTTRNAIKYPERTEDVKRYCILKTSLNPHGAIWPVEFKEYGNLWLGDSAKTIMDSSEILNDPGCLESRLRSILSQRHRFIYVVYDIKANKEFLVIKNYD